MVGFVVLVEGHRSTFDLADREERIDLLQHLLVVIVPRRIEKTTSTWDLVERKQVSLPVRWVAA